MARLGPFEPNPALAAAVSGGADSMALALLARNWVRQHHGTIYALVVDHGLRSESEQEARTTVSRLSSLGVSSTLMTITTLRRGSALAERARIMRYEALSAACRSAGILHLLVGHHRLDQIETMMMRVLRHSLVYGLAVMPALAEAAQVRLLRPLLAFDPVALRGLLAAHGIDWDDDPSNRDVKALRSRLRMLSVAHLSDGSIASLAKAAKSIGARRAVDEAATARELAGRAIVRPEGFALLSPGRISVEALAALIQTIAGAPYAPSAARIADLAAHPRPATVAGVRLLLPAGRIGNGLLLVREEAAIAAPAAASLDVLWDGRFRLVTDQAPPPGTSVGKLGSDAAHFRGHSPLPSAILRTLPTIRHGQRLVAVPHLGYVTDNIFARTLALFTPRKSLAGPCFFPA
jgi:tRNA(Ile)-lysidine synthase